MNRIKISVIFTLSLLALLSCGIDEIPYLPQVPEGWITTVRTDRADIKLDPLFFDSISYATGYIIYYKIYIISTVYDTVPELISRNSRISSDYNALRQYTDPTNTSSIPSLNTFKNRGFYELELEKDKIRETVLSKTGVPFSIQFPLRRGEPPFIDITNTPNYIIYRSTDGGAFNPKPDRYFLGSSDLKNYEYATEKSPTINADVSGQSGVSEHAYTSMYIVPVGINKNFSRLYGKPTHISIFKLPES